MSLICKATTQHMSQGICGVHAHRSNDSAQTILKNLRRARNTSDSPRAPGRAGQYEDEYNTHTNLSRSPHAALL